MSVTAPGDVQELPVEWTCIARTTAFESGGRFELYHVTGDEYAVVYDTPRSETPAYHVPNIVTVESLDDAGAPLPWDEIEDDADRGFTDNERETIEAAVVTLMRDTLGPVLDPGADVDPTSVRVVSLSDWFFAVDYDREQLRELLAEELVDVEGVTPGDASDILEAWAGDFLCGIDLNSR